MKIKDLIAELQKYPEDMEVCIMDDKMNLHHTNDEPNGIGIQPNFLVEDISEFTNEPLVVLVYDNQDYNDDGEFIKDI